MRSVIQVVLAGLILAGCSAPRPVPPRAVPPRPVPARPVPAPKLARLGFTIQAGAFARVENASRLADLLQSRGLDAVYYAAQPGLYRVRFGDFPTREAARARAEALRAAGVIREFYLVPPEEPPLARPAPRELTGLRANLVETAATYLGVPYLWGGTTPKGFDCSGLAMAVYRLNGLQLPRNSKAQFDAGTRTTTPSPGDLVFFATAGGNEVSHVGIYAGDDVFIHAPGRGRRIARERLGDPYYRDRYLGARSYLD